MNVESFPHEPVLVSSVLEHLAPSAGQIVLDGTVGLGGHAAAIAPRLAPGGVYIGLDVDGAMLDGARRRLAGLSDPVIHLEQWNYAEFPALLQRLGIEQVDAMLLDLGINSAQLAAPERGFSFECDGPLDMRFDARQKTSASDLVNSLSERELADLFYDFGQETLSRKIAKRICELRRESRLTTTRLLALAAESVYGGMEKHSTRVHAATRIFQALRIAVNHELDNLTRFLQCALPHLRPGGRLAVVSFHSLEDGIVKHFLLERKKAGEVDILTKSPVGPDEQERRTNRRSRSAKLRAARRVA